MSGLRLRRDKHKGWTLVLHGCDHPFKSAHMMYRGQLRKGWDRRIAVAVAANIVGGSERARRYLVRRDWSPAGRPISTRGAG